MKKFWVSWWHNSEKMGEFELHTPWWMSGTREDEDCSMVAAVQADSEEEAERIICGAYDNKHIVPQWRFCEEQPEEWSPFNSRFTRFPWMQWPEEV